MKTGDRKPPPRDLTREERARAVLSELLAESRWFSVLLRQVAARPGALTPEVLATLEVWDAKLVTSGEALADARQALVDQLEPALSKAYQQVAGGDAEIAATTRRIFTP